MFCVAGQELLGYNQSVEMQLVWIWIHSPYQQKTNVTDQAAFQHLYTAFQHANSPKDLDVVAWARKFQDRFPLPGQAQPDHVVYLSTNILAWAAAMQQTQQSKEVLQAEAAQPLQLDQAAIRDWELPPMSPDSQQAGNAGQGLGDADHGSAGTRHPFGFVDHQAEIARQGVLQAVHNPDVTESALQLADEKTMTQLMLDAAAANNEQLLQDNVVNAHALAQTQAPSVLPVHQQLAANGVMSPCNSGLPCQHRHVDTASTSRGGVDMSCSFVSAHQSQANQCCDGPTCEAAEPFGVAPDTACSLDMLQDSNTHPVLEESGSSPQSKSTSQLQSRSWSESQAMSTSSSRAASASPQQQVTSSPSQSTCYDIGEPPASIDMLDLLAGEAASASDWPKVFSSAELVEAVKAVNNFRCTGDDRHKRQCIESLKVCLLVSLTSAHTP